MKTLFIATLFVALATVSNAQFRVDMGVGYSSSKYATAELSVGYNFKPAFIQAGYLVHITNEVKGGSVFNVRLGHRFAYGEWGFEPSAGYAYTLRSNDNKSLNESGYIVSAYVTKWVYPNAHLFAGLNRVSTAKTWIANVGIRFFLEEKSRGQGCF